MLLGAQVLFNLSGCLRTLDLVVHIIPTAEICTNGDATGSAGGLGPSAWTESNLDPLGGNRDAVSSFADPLCRLTRPSAAAGGRRTNMSTKTGVKAGSTRPYMWRSSHDAKCNFYDYTPPAVEGRLRNMTVGEALESRRVAEFFTSSKSPMSFIEREPRKPERIT